MEDYINVRADGCSEREHVDRDGQDPRQFLPDVAPLVAGETYHDD